MTKRVILFNGLHAVGEKSFEGGIEISISENDFRALNNAGAVYKNFDATEEVEQEVELEVEKEKDPFAGMTFAELKALAKEKGIVVKVGTGRDALIQLLK